MAHKARLSIGYGPWVMVLLVFIPGYMNQYYWSSRYSYWQRQLEVNNIISIAIIL